MNLSKINPDTLEESMDKKRIEKEISFWESYLKLLERKAIEKELDSFVKEHGFSSTNHLARYFTALDDYLTKSEKLKSFKGCDIEFETLKKEVKEAETFKNWMKSSFSYSIIMKMSGLKNI